MTISILPDSRAKTVLTAKNAVNRGGAFWVPVFCASCHKHAGHVPESGVTFAFILCDPCGEKFGDIDGVYKEPHTVFFERVAAEQQEHYGHVLTFEETVKALDDPNSLESRLADNRAGLTPGPSA